MWIQKYTFVCSRLAFCFAFAACLASCSAGTPKKDALLYQRVQEYHSAINWNSAVKSSTFTKDLSLRSEILRGMAKESNNMQITEYITTSVEVDEQDKNTANVTALMKYLKTPVNVLKTRETNEKWQYSDHTWFLVETDAFKK